MLEEKSNDFSEEDLQQAWEVFKQKRIADGASDTEMLVLHRNVVKSGECNAKIILESQLEISILEKFEQHLMKHFRQALENTSIQIEKEVSEQELTKSLYTSREKFDYMVQQNPALLVLKEKLGLDFDF